MTIVCSRCAAPLEPDAMFCPSCGAPTTLDTSLSCPKCGKLITVEMRFCKYCAAELSRAGVATQAIAMPGSINRPDKVMLESPEDKTFFISPAGAAIAVLCFFLPWVEVSCNSFGGRELHSVSGADMGGILWIAFVAAIAIIVAVLVYRAQNQLQKAQPIVILCAITAFVVMLIQYIRFSNETSGQQTPFGRVRPEDLGISFSIQIGGIGTLLGFAVALIGSAFLKPAPLTLDDDRPVKDMPPSRPFEAKAAQIYQQSTATMRDAQTNITEEIQKVTLRVAAAGQEFGKWFIKKDVLGRLRRHALLLAAVSGGVVALVIVYYAFVKPNPTADAKTAALRYIDCQTAYKAKVDSVYQSFISQFDSQHYRVRADAERSLEAFLSGERQVYIICSGTADAKYNEFTARYRDDSDDSAAFSKAFSEDNGRRKSAQEIEQSSSLFGAANEKIRSVRALMPDSSRIATDLVGHSMDGWNFSYASEFKGINIITQKLDGDALVLRTHLKLEDYNTKEAYLAVLDLSYSLNSNGEWDYNGFTQLLYDKAEVDYFISDEIFLVGKWRWPDNYVTYAADGGWSAKWDDGSESTGTWRIVRGSLVLTRDGSNWFSGKIVQHTKNELLVGEPNPVRAERVRE